MAEIKNDHQRECELGALIRKIIDEECLSISHGHDKKKKEPNLSTSKMNGRNGKALKGKK